MTMMWMEKEGVSIVWEGVVVEEQVAPRDLSDVLLLLRASPARGLSSRTLACLVLALVRVWGVCSSQAGVRGAWAYTFGLEGKRDIHMVPSKRALYGHREGNNTNANTAMSVVVQLAVSGKYIRGGMCAANTRDTKEVHTFEGENTATRQARHTLLNERLNFWLWSLLHQNMGLQSIRLSSDSATTVFLPVCFEGCLFLAQVYACMQCTP